jgi:outer membrane protein assembly factor BamB
MVDGAFVFTPTWQLDSGTGTEREETYGLNPAAAGGVSVSLNGHVLQARSTRTGTGLWEYRGDGRLTGLPAIVNHTVYVGSASGALFAVDLVTGEETWSAQVGPISTCVPSYSSCSA